MTRLADLVSFLDETLHTREIPDYPSAINGLQLATDADIRRVAAAVDFSRTTVRGAIERRAELLVVHHGMFWGGLQPITGPTYERLRDLIAAGVAVYSSHLPLDLHPELGNNVLLARRLGLTPSGGFARYKTIDIGVSGEADVLTAHLVEAAGRLACEHDGHVVATPHAPDRRTKRWAICTGAGASSETIVEAMDRGIDTLIVGEGPHHTAVMATDAGLTIVYAGHYATETLGVRAVADVLARRFGLEHFFVDAPTGL